MKNFLNNIKSKLCNFIIKLANFKKNYNEPLAVYTNKDSTNIFDIEIETEFEKLVLTKNSAGVVTDYELSADAEFTVYSSNKAQKTTFNFNETVSIKNRDDTFEQVAYEKNIKQNFASSLREKLILNISSIKINVLEQQTTK